GRQIARPAGRSKGSGRSVRWHYQAGTAAHAVARRGARMDRADLDDVPEPDSKTQGLNLSPRLNFVPPPELPTPESASTKDRARALCIGALIGLATLILLAARYGC